MILSCKQVENFPVIPQITFESLKTYGYDSAICKITFVDGDGDIGLDPFMTQPPFDTTSRYYNDLFLKLYWDSLGIWKVGLKPNLHTGIYDTIQSRFRIPNLTPNGQAKALKGEIKVKLFAPYSIPGQRFKYSIRLYDRALHASNIVESDAQPAPY
ncbi:MAG TPA: hypothetical protein VNZ86_00150 [Bacteroidia bacterium]|nr:hypothetical protein [Bacteroidia bacterium]